MEYSQSQLEGIKIRLASRRLSKRDVTKLRYQLDSRKPVYMADDGYEYEVEILRRYECSLSKNLSKEYFCDAKDEFGNTYENLRNFYISFPEEKVLFLIENSGILSWVKAHVNDMPLIGFNVLKTPFGIMLYKEASACYGNAWLRLYEAMGLDETDDWKNISDEDAIKFYEERQATVSNYSKNSKGN